MGGIDKIMTNLDPREAGALGSAALRTEREMRVSQESKRNEVLQIGNPTPSSQIQRGVPQVEGDNGSMTPEATPTTSVAPAKPPPPAPPVRGRIAETPESPEEGVRAHSRAPGHTIPTNMFTVVRKGYQKGKSKAKANHQLTRKADTRTNERRDSKGN